MHACRNVKTAPKQTQKSIHNETKNGPRLIQNRTQAALRYLGAPQARFGGFLGAPQAVPGAPWSGPGTTRNPLGRSWAPTRATLGPSGNLSGHTRSVLRRLLERPKPFWIPAWMQSLTGHPNRSILHRFSESPNLDFRGQAQCFVRFSRFHCERVCIHKTTQKRLSKRPFCTSKSTHRGRSEPPRTPKSIDLGRSDPLRTAKSID